MKKFLTNFSSKKDNHHLIEEANALRDSGRYAEAAVAYAAYLAETPKDFGIWVQRGNCLKDSGQYEAAKIAYETAVLLNSNDSDVYLQLGHLAKLVQDHDAAIKHYKKSLFLNPENHDAQLELYQISPKIDSSSRKNKYRSNSDKKCNFYDITDLLTFMNDNLTVTGIQRVEYFIILHSLKDNKTNDYINNNISFCYLEDEVFKVINVDKLRNLVDLISKNNSTRREMDRCLNSIKISSATAEFHSKDSFTIIGAFWINSKFFLPIHRIKQNGVKIGVYIYDLIPITHPQFVEKYTQLGHSNGFKSLIPLCDYILTISDYVKKEVIQICQNEIARGIPVESVKLGHSLPKNHSEGEDDTDVNIFGIVPGNYVLSVGTIEGRKNHKLLVDIWLTLFRKYGHSIPHLVFIGRWGWHTEQLRNYLEDINYLDGKIKILGNLSDNELSNLYNNCLFTSFPSFVEGWGLPVGESLSHGKPCIASNATSIPEVGGDFCRYINPHDLIGSTAIFEKFIKNPGEIADWAKYIQSNFKPNHWHDVVDNFNEKINSLCSSLSETSIKDYNIVFSPGTIYEIKYDSVLSETVSWRQRMMQFILADKWYDIEPWGVWSSNPVSNITIYTNFVKNTLVRIALFIQIPPPEKSGSAVIEINGIRTNISFKNNQPIWVWADGIVEDKGKIVINLERSGKIGHIDDQRKIFLGISALGYYEKSDIHAKISLLESVISTIHV
ncbi:MAG TPA: glycosyltransferase [Acidiphilium sp.]|nr:glycosyltransferase [Acidiphilium sp.]